jgi:hypothetical protein
MTSTRGDDGLQAVFELGEDGWLGHVPALPGSWVTGTSLSETRRKLRKLVERRGDGPTTLREEIRVDPEIQRQVDALVDARGEYQEARERLREEMCATAEMLRRRGLSTRDAGAVLGVSQQRVAQLWKELG